MDKKPVIKKVEEDKYILDKQDIEVMRKALIHSPKPIRDLAIFETLRATGCRCSELRHIRVMDLELGKARVFIQKPKKTVIWNREREEDGSRGFYLEERTRTSFLDAWALKAVSDYLIELKSSLKPKSYLFQVQERQIFNVIRGAAQRAFGDQMTMGKLKAGLISPHALRHTRATDLLAKGIPEAYIKKVMGWRKGSRTFEKTYQHASDDTIQSVMEARIQSAEAQDEEGHLPEDPDRAARDPGPDESEE